MKMNLVDWLLDGPLSAAVRQRIHAAAISVRVDDSRGWDPLMHGYGPADRPWGERRDDLDDALEAWRKNFLVRRIVNLISSYVVGSGIAISSKQPTVNTFVTAFCNHPNNRLDRRLRTMCNELTRAGELFPILFTNKIDGMSYIRFLPASRIRAIDTDPDDYEKELRYGQITNNSEPKWWLSPEHPNATRQRADGSLPPVMLHFAVNRPIGATRGEGDLLPVLPWARRYSEWLQDRVRLNRLRTRQGMLDLNIADDVLVQEKRQQLRTDNPWTQGIYVHGPGEEMQLHNLQIRADDAEKDGRVLRLAVVAGANVALHYLGEGEATNYATAKAMGEPTARFFTDRQTDFCHFLEDLATVAYQRKRAMVGARHFQDLQIDTTATEVARDDNQSLATAARDIVTALTQMRQYGWIDDQTAATMAFKFAGEPLGEEEVQELLNKGIDESPIPEREPTTRHHLRAV